MNIKELNTFNNLIRSNDSFLHAINTLTSYKPDIYFKVELLIIYIKSKYNMKYQFVELPSIIKHLLQANYYIEDESVVIDNTKYSVEELYNAIKAADIKPYTEAPISFHIYPVIGHISKGNGKIININKLYVDQDYTLHERGYIFERTCRIDAITIPFIREMNHRFEELIEYLITHIVVSNIDIDEDRLYKIIAAYIKLYPYVDYAKEKMDIPFETLELPFNEIGLTKVKYSDSYLDELKARINTLNKCVQKMVHDTEVIMDSCYIINHRILEQRNRQVIELNSKLASAMIEYNEYSHNPDVINRIFFEYIYEAFSNGNVIINEYFADPVLKFFTIKDHEVTSYIHIHLNTLLRLLDTNVLTATDKKLKYQAN